MKIQARGSTVRYMRELVGDNGHLSCFPVEARLSAVWFDLDDELAVERYLAASLGIQPSQVDTRWVSIAVNEVHEAAPVVFRPAALGLDQGVAV